MDNFQIIHSPKGEEMIVISRKEYDRLTQLAYDEDTHDAGLAAAQIKKLKTGQTTLVPGAVVNAIAVDGVHPVKAWRNYRGWTGKELAKKAKLARSTISQMETGKRKGTLAAYKAIAKALGTAVASLIE